MYGVKDNVFLDSTSVTICSCVDYICNEMTDILSGQKMFQIELITEHLDSFSRQSIVRNFLLWVLHTKTKIQKIASLL